MGTPMKVDRLEHEHAIPPTLLVSRDQTVTSANSAALKLLGFRADELVGLSLKWLSPPSQHGVLDNIHAVFTLRKPVRVNTVLLHNNGTRVDVAMVMEPTLGTRGEVSAVRVRCEAPRPSLPPRALTVMPSQDTTGITARSSLLASQRNTIPPTAPRVSALHPANDQTRESLTERLESAVQLMRWAANLLTAPSDGTDDARDRARLLLVLRDASELVEECQRELALDPAAVNVPKAPPLPRFPF